MKMSTIYKTTFVFHDLNGYILYRYASYIYISNLSMLSRYCFNLVSQLDKKLSSLQNYKIFLYDKVL